MPIVALTGGIAAGKSVVADTLSAHGIVVIDADQVARDVVEPGSPALERIAEVFGEQVIGADGRLDRAALGEKVFSDPAAREHLNDIVHPAVWQRSQDQFENHLREHPEVPLVYAIPLLAEGSRVNEFDLVVLVDAPAQVREARLVRKRGMSETEASSRVSAQASDEERRAIADVVIDSSAELSDTQAQARTLAALLLEHWPDTLSAIPRQLPPSAE